MDEDTLSFGILKNSLTFNITNKGTGLLDWSISAVTDDGGEWITSTPSQGSTPSDQIDQVTVEVDRSELAGSIYYGWLRITSDDGYDSLRVIMQVVEGNVVFFDDFSGTLSEWTTSYCDAWISDEVVHLVGNTSGYYGTLRHSFSNYFNPEYTINAKAALTNPPNYDDYYGLLIYVNDTGYPSIPCFWFQINPTRSDNWEIWAFLSAGSNSGWALLASDSKGHSLLIKTWANGWNDVTWTVKNDKAIMIKIGKSVLYYTNEIADIEREFGISISMGLEKVGIRTLDDLEIAGDDILVYQRTPGLMKSYSSQDNRLASQNENNTQDVIFSDLSKSASELPTLKEVLKKLLNK